MLKRKLFREALGEVMRQERHAQALSLRTVSIQASVSLGYLCEIERGDKEVSSQLLERIALDGLGVEPCDIIIKAGMRLGGLDIPNTVDELLERVDEYADLIPRRK